MKGEKAFQEALNNHEDHITGEPNSFYGVHPLKRAFIAFCGPFFNVLFAVVAFTVISMVGYDFYSADNRIVLATEVFLRRWRLRQKKHYSLLLTETDSHFLLMSCLNSINHRGQAKLEL